MKNKLLISLGLIYAMTLPTVSIFYFNKIVQKVSVEKIDSKSMEDTTYHNKVLTIKSGVTVAKLGPHANKEIDRIVFEDPSKITSIDKGFLKGFSLKSEGKELSKKKMSLDEISNKINKFEKDSNTFYLSENGGYFNLNIFKNLRRIEKDTFMNFNLNYLSIDKLHKLNFIGENAFGNSNFEFIKILDNNKLDIGLNAFGKATFNANIYINDEWRYDEVKNLIDWNSPSWLGEISDNKRKEIFGDNWNNLIFSKDSDSWLNPLMKQNPNVSKVISTENNSKKKIWKRFVKFPNDLKIIEDSFFANSNVKGGILDLSNTNVQSIGNNAFGNISSFSEIIIPDSITSIGKNAFGKSIKSTMVKISQKKWENLIKGRELEIFGKNGNFVKRINDNEHGFKMSNGFIKDEDGTKITDENGKYMQNINLFSTSKFEDSKTSSDDQYYPQSNESSYSMNSNLLGEIVADNIYLTKDDFDNLNESNFHEKVMDKLTFNYGENVFNNLKNVGRETWNLKNTTNKPILISFEKNYKTKTLNIKLAKVLNKNQNPGWDSAQRFVYFDLKFTSESIQLDSNKQNEKVEINKIWKMNGIIPAIPIEDIKNSSVLFSEGFTGDPNKINTHYWNEKEFGTNGSFSEGGISSQSGLIFLDEYGIANPSSGTVNGWDIKHGIAGTSDRYMGPSASWHQNPILVVYNKDEFVSFKTTVSYVFDWQGTTNKDSFEKRWNYFKGVNPMFGDNFWRDTKLARGRITIEIKLDSNGNPVVEYSNPYKAYLNEDFWVPGVGTQVLSNAWLSYWPYYQIAAKDSGSSQGKVGIKIEKGSYGDNGFEVALVARLLNYPGEDGLVIWNQETSLKTRKRVKKVGGFYIGKNNPIYPPSAANGRSATISDLKTFNVNTTFNNGVLTIKENVSKINFIPYNIISKISKIVFSDPKSIIEIGYSAFLLSNITFLDLSSLPNLNSIGDKAFFSIGKNAKVKVSQSQWNKLILGREESIFGSNFSSIRRID